MYHSEGSDILEYDAVLFGEWFLTFPTNTVSSSAGSGSPRTVEALCLWNTSWTTHPMIVSYSIQKHSWKNLKTCRILQPPLPIFVAY